MLKRIKNIIRNVSINSIEPRKAYDIWADAYDSQDDNLVFIMESEILDTLLDEIDLTEKVILDYGCGTGRNWERILSYNVEKIIGCDISPNMLEKIKNKYQGYETYFIKKHSPLPLEDEAIDIIFSTLVIAQINNINNLFSEWNRLLRPGGLILLTDLHPEILSAGGKRTFEKDGRTYNIKNYIHSIEKIKMICAGFNLEVKDLKERHITAESKAYYEKKNALHIYNKFYGLPLVYGILIRKKQ